MMRRIVRGLRRRLLAAVKFLLRPGYRFLRHHFHSEIEQLRQEVVSLRREVTALRGAALETHTAYLQQMADEYVRLHARCEARNDQSRAA